LPDEAARIVILAAMVGLVVSPLLDRLSKRVFHGQVKKMRFYESFIKSFGEHFNILVNEHPTEQRIKSFSGSLDLVSTLERIRLINAYKVFARRGWGNSEEVYRIRTEKSFGVLYLSVAVYATALTAISASRFVLAVDISPHLTRWLLETAALVAVAVVCTWEAYARFRMSLTNELIALSGHSKELKQLYDEFGEGVVPANLT
jgi:hypothetical protein